MLQSGNCVGYSCIMETPPRTMDQPDAPLELLEDNDWFDVLVAVNERWLSAYARTNPSFAVNPSLLARNSLWMNTYFQKQRIITSPLSKQAKTLLAQHQQTVLTRLRLGGSHTSSEADYSTAIVEPIAALMFAASADRCPEYQIENMLTEAHELLQSREIRVQALRAGFAGCIFRFLSSYTETSKRILTLRILVLLAEEDTYAVVQACKVAAQGQLWQPNMFIYTLQKRHRDNIEICDLAAALLSHFAGEMPISSPIKFDSPRSESASTDHDTSALFPSTGSTRAKEPRAGSLPLLSSPSKKSLEFTHRPTTTMSSLYVENTSPYSSQLVLPIARPPPPASEQARRSVIFSTPKERAIAGDRKRRCLTPNIAEPPRDSSQSEDLAWLDSSGSPPKSPATSAEKKPVVVSEKYSWNPDCINSVSGFEWWWRSLPQHHANLEPTQKLKMVTKAAVRLHTKGQWERAVELYLLALSMDISDEVQFRLRINLGCAYEVGLEHAASEAEFRAALRINPDDPYAKFKLASALLAMGRLDDAKIIFQSVVSVYPQAEDSLRRIQELREELQKKEAAELALLSTARTARSPSKPGRRLQSRGETARDVSLPQVHSPKAPGASPRVVNWDDATTDVPVSPPVTAAIGGTAPESSALQTETEPPGKTPPNNSSDAVAVISEADAKPDLIASLFAQLQAKNIDLRMALRFIDRERTGYLHLTTMTKLIAHLLDAAEGSVEQWLRHPALQASAVGMVRYENLLESLIAHAEIRPLPGSVEWLQLVETLEARELMLQGESNKFHLDLAASVEVDVSHPVSKQNVGLSDTSASGGPHERDVEANVVPKSEETSSHRAAPAEDVCAYQSLSARLDEKREKARQEAILRAERSRVVARKHLHCHKALQEIGVRARQHLLKREEALTFLQDTGTTAVDKCRLQADRGGEQREPETLSTIAPTPPESTLVPNDDIAPTLSPTQQFVDHALDVAMRNVVVARGVDELRALAVQFSLTCCVPLALQS